MAVKVGRNGAVYVGGTIVAEVVSFQYDETADEIEVKAMKDTAKRYEAGLTDSQGQFACNYDEDDTVQQGIANASTVTISLRPEDGSGNEELTGSVKITGVSIGSEVDGIATRNFTFRGNLTSSAQA